MVGFLSGKMKRKDVDDVSDEFSEFSLSSLARKIRRLDADLPPIMEEDEVVVPQVYQQQWPRNTAPEIDSLVENAPVIPANEERAIVLYKPVDTPILLSPGSSNSCFTMSSNLFPGLKNKVFWRRNSNLPTVREVEDDKSLAIVPWVSKGSVEEEEEEAMDTEGAECSSMEVEEVTEETTASTGLGIGSEVFHQCHQHCMASHIPTARSTPIMW